MNEFDDTSSRKCRAATPPHEKDRAELVHHPTRRHAGLLLGQVLQRYPTGGDRGLLLSAGLKLKMVRCSLRVSRIRNESIREAEMVCTCVEEGGWIRWSCQAGGEEHKELV